jgi:LysR family glycine cleavage system transcriptional activator
MARHRVPSTASLQGFEASARLNSFSRAAQELNLTQGAVSRQVSGLEQQLGVELFVRRRQRIELTAAGRDYLAEIQPLLAQLSSATDKLSRRAKSENGLRVAVQPTLGTRWLIPRLALFMSSHPDIQIDFSVQPRPFEQAVEQFDLIIHYGRPALRHLTFELLLQDKIAPVCSPDFRQRHQIASPTDLSRVPLLQQDSRLESWPHWFRQAGVRDRNPRSGIRFERIITIVEAAVAGLGVALLPRFLIEDELSRGELIYPFARKAMLNGGYYVAYQRATVTGEARTFLQWLRKMARHSARS